LHTAGIKDILILTRFPVSLAVTVTSLTAMIMASGEFNIQMLWPLGGIFLLASGASAFNQYQEWPWDEKMERTRRRPIPSRRISPSEGLRIALITLVGGLIILMYRVNWNCFILGVINLLWYNGFYTWLKKKTAFAVVPGALTGSIPVLMGWSAVENDYFAPPAVFLAFFIFIWQMPHFWMLSIKYGDEYSQAGFPMLKNHFSEKQIRIIIMAWVIASSAASLMFIYFNLLNHPVIIYAVGAINLILISTIFYQFFLSGRLHYHLIFMTANLYMMGVMVALIVETLLNN
jgi:protoheme IX farnesyltransferase